MDSSVYCKLMSRINNIKISHPAISSVTNHIKQKAISPEPETFKLELVSHGSE